MTALSLLPGTWTVDLVDAPYSYPSETLDEAALEFLRQASYESEDTAFRKPGYTQFEAPFRGPGYTQEFEVDKLRVPVASERWAVKWPGHPEITFEDLRAGRLPKPTLQELASRQEAIQQAREIRTRLDIRPLTTSTIIRQLREGTEEE